MKRLISLLLAVLFVASLAVGCAAPAKTDTTDTAVGDTAADTATEKEETGKPQEPKLLRVGWYNDITTLDFQRVTNSDDYDMQRMVTERLVRNTGGSFSPGVATSWECSADGLVWTFKLRESTYSDGTPITANDFVYSFRRLVDPANALEAAFYGYVIKNGEAIFKGEMPVEELGVVAKDDYTLEITLQTTSASFLYTICDWAFAPLNQAFVEKCGELYGTEPQYFLSNGPYNVSEWVRESEVVLTKNGTYWDADSIHIDTMRLIAGVSYQTAVDLMMADEIDCCRLYSYTYMLELQDMCDVTGYDAGHQFCHVNHSGKTKETGKFLSNVNFRKALILAVSRQDIVNSVFTNAVPSTRITSPNLMTVDNVPFDELYPLEAWPADSDVTLAKQYLQTALDELGCTIDDVPTFTFMCYESESSMTIMQAIMDMLLTNLGIHAEIDAQAVTPLFSKYYAGDWDFFWSGWVFEEPDWLAEIGSKFYSGSNSNYIGYNNPEYDEVYLKAVAAPDMKTRYELLYKLEQILCNDALGILIGWSQTYHCAKPNVSGYVCYGGYTNYTYADINN